MTELSDFNPPERGYLHVLRVHALLFWLPLLIGALVADRLLLADSPFAWLVPAVAAVLAVIGIVIAPGRIFRRLGWRVDKEQLQAVRGWMVHIDTIVPFVRVQHIDVSRGPLDKAFGTASLIVHTAGTHNATVAIPGLAPERADALRSSIRDTIRSDLE
jgi:membrane protein YdbS with pleckstrin-like domain